MKTYKWNISRLRVVIPRDFPEYFTIGFSIFRKHFTISGYPPRKTFSVHLHSQGVPAIARWPALIFRNFPGIPIIITVLRNFPVGISKLWYVILGGNSSSRDIFPDYYSANRSRGGVYWPSGDKHVEGGAQRISNRMRVRGAFPSC